METEDLDSDIARTTLSDDSTAADMSLKPDLDELALLYKKLKNGSMSAECVCQSESVTVLKVKLSK